MFYINNDSEKKGYKCFRGLQEIKWLGNYPVTYFLKIILLSEHSLLLSRFGIVNDGNKLINDVDLEKLQNLSSQMTLKNGFNLLHVFFVCLLLFFSGMPSTLITISLLLGAKSNC